MPTHYENLKKISEKNDEVSFQADIPLAILEKNMAQVVIREAADFALPGFRKGKVPEHIVRQHMSEMDLLEDAAQTEFRDAIREIVADEKLSIIGAPQVAITKIALRNPVTFTARFALYPTFTLPDYKKIGRAIAERKEASDTTEEDVDAAIARIQKMMAPATNNEPAPDENKDTAHEDVDKTETKEKKGAPLPPVTDDFVKKFGNFENVAAFRAEVRKQLEREKEVRIKESKREEIVKKIMEASKIKIPALLVDEEFYDFVERRDHELEHAGMSLEEYLKEIKKTEKELEQQERKLIEDRIKMSLVMGEIRKKEDINANEDEVHAFMPSLKYRYPDRSEEDMHRTAEAYIIQEKLFEALEGKETEEVESPIKEEQP